MPLSKRRRQTDTRPQPATERPAASPAADAGPPYTKRVLAVLAYLEDHEEMGAADRSLARQPVIREAAAMLLSESPRQPADAPS